MKSIKKSFLVTSLTSNNVKEFNTEIEATDFILSNDTDEKYFIMPTYKSLPQQQCKFRISIIMPIFGAPLRTIRAIMSVVAQNTNGWQLICIGDGCEYFIELMESSWFKDIQSRAYLDGNEVIALSTEHVGGYGFHQREIAKELATGEWTIYLDNDDVLKTTHVSTRLSAVGKNTEIDLLYFNTWLEPIRWHREAELEFGRVGHSEVMYRTDFLKTLPPLNAEYGHDWIQIKQAIDKGARTKKVSGDPTYIVKSLPDKREEGID